MTSILHRISSWWASSLLLLCAAGTVATACSDDDPPAMKPKLPGGGAENVRTIRHRGGQTQSYDWTFTYSDGRLVQANGTVRDPNAAIDGTFSYTSKLSFHHDGVSVYNSSGEKTQITLNSEGYIEKMTVNRNIYKFYYRDGHLAEWEKTIFENSFGQAQQYTSSGRFTYSNGNITGIEYREAGAEPVSLTLVPSELPNINGLLPEAISKELGCLGLEHLYYAGLMGQPTVNLVKSISASYPSQPDKNYTINFEYSNRNGNTDLCNYHTPEGQVASVNYEY